MFFRPVTKVSTAFLNLIIAGALVGPGPKHELFKGKEMKIRYVFCHCGGLNPNSRHRLFMHSVFIFETCLRSLRILLTNKALKLYNFCGNIRVEIQSECIISQICFL